MECVCQLPTVFILLLKVNRLQVSAIFVCMNTVISANRRARTIKFNIGMSYNNTQLKYVAKFSHVPYKRIKSHSKCNFTAFSFFGKLNKYHSPNYYCTWNWLRLDKLLRKIKKYWFSTRSLESMQYKIRKTLK